MAQHGRNSRLRVDLRVVEGGPTSAVADLEQCYAAELQERSRSIRAVEEDGKVQRGLAIAVAWRGLCTTRDQGTHERLATHRGRHVQGCPAFAVGLVGVRLLVEQSLQTARVVALRRG
jgi:hypothetical protein